MLTIGYGSIQETPVIRTAVGSVCIDRLPNSSTGHSVAVCANVGLAALRTEREVDFTKYIATHITHGNGILEPTNTFSN